jgi:hypothetical protein
MEERYRKLATSISLTNSRIVPPVSHRYFICKRRNTTWSWSPLFHWQMPGSYLKVITTISLADFRIVRQVSHHFSLAIDKIVPEASHHNFIEKCQRSTWRFSPPFRLKMTGLYLKLSLLFYWQFPGYYLQLVTALSLAHARVVPEVSHHYFLANGERVSEAYHQYFIDKFKDSASS